MKRSTLLCVFYCLISLFVGFSSAVVAAPIDKIDKIIVFGDSLSDTGNIYHLTTALNKVISQVPIIPKSPPYFNGRFSNGPVWIENLANVLNIPMQNYAYGGAWVEPLIDSKQIIPFGIGTQIDMYLVENVLDINKKNHLYVIWAGGNDYIHGRSDPDYATTNTVNYIQNQIDWLIFAGAENFLILNLPDLANIPQVMAQGPEFAANASHLSQLHNEKLSVMIKNERQEHPGVKIVLEDVSVTFRDMIAHPGRYYLINVVDACYTGGYLPYALTQQNKAELAAAKAANINIADNPSLYVAYTNSLLAKKGQFTCDQPERYFFWDQIHPSNSVHQILTVLTVQTLITNNIRS